MNIYSSFFDGIKNKNPQKIISEDKIFRKLFLLKAEEQTMAENYARENTTRGNNKNTNCCKNKSPKEVCDSRTPMSKQNAAQRKTQDCDR